MEHSFEYIELIDDLPWSKFITLWKRNICPQHYFKDKNLLKQPTANQVEEVIKIFPIQILVSHYHYIPVCVETKLYYNSYYQSSMET